VDKKIRPGRAVQEQIGAGGGREDAELKTSGSSRCRTPPASRSWRSSRTRAVRERVYRASIGRASGGPSDNIA